ncbi:hypothetical protein ACFQ3N_14985 [Virgibacillus byunsanensis]|uniref:DUF2651 domain-containing protein n=1 Tax=Virgibacillus byunsanensis TaxID=570945 RepID=A0ABW3LMT9_9BACI
MKIKKTAIFTGVTAGISSMVLWIIMNFYNPYSSILEYEPLASTFFMLFLPAALATVAALTSKKFFMLITFLWSLPLSLYFLLTPGIFALFGITSFAYLISYLFMREKKRSVHTKNINAPF